MSNNFKIVISAVDQATATIRKINDSMSRITRPISEIKKSVGALGKELGLDKVGKSMAAVSKSASDLAGKVSSIIAPMAAVVGVGSIAGVVALATEWAHLGLEISNTSKTLGMATSDLMSMRGAATLAGVSAEALTGGLKSVGDTMQDALFGRNQSALMLLDKMNVGIHKTADGSIDAARGFKDIATYISKVPSAQVQSLVARQFGLEALLPLLRKGAKGIEEYQRKVAEFGGSQSQQSIASAEDFGLKLNFLSMSVGGLKTSIGDKLIPVLSPFIDKLTSWIVANRDLIATNIAKFVQGFATWLEKIDFNKVLKGVTDFIRKIGQVVDGLGGWKTVLLAIVGMKVLGAVSPLISLAAALTQVGVSLGLIAAGTAGVALLIGAVGALGVYAGYKGAEYLFGDMSSSKTDSSAKPAPHLRTKAALREEASRQRTDVGLSPLGPGAMMSKADLRQEARLQWMESFGMPRGKAAPRGIRNNNPGNLMEWGNMPRKDGYAVFPTPEAGLTAAIKNLQAQQNKHGLNTIEGIVKKWAPPNENNTEAYIADVEKQTGFGRNQALNLSDRKTVAPLISSIIKHEGNGAAYSKEMVDDAVTKVVVEFKGAPPGTSAVASDKGGKSVPVRINHTMPSLAAG